MSRPSIHLGNQTTLYLVCTNGTINTSKLPALRFALSNRMVRRTFAPLIIVRAITTHLSAQE